MVEVHCQCGTRLDLPDEWAGKKGKCPNCGAVLDIPRVDHRTEPPQPAAAPQEAPARRQPAPTPPQRTVPARGPAATTPPRPASPAPNRDRPSRQGASAAASSTRPVRPATTSPAPPAEGARPGGIAATLARVSSSPKAMPIAAVALVVVVLLVGVTAYMVRSRPDQPDGPEVATNHRDGSSTVDPIDPRDATSTGQGGGAVTRDPSTPDIGSTGVAVSPLPESNGSPLENGSDQTTDPRPEHVGVEPPPVDGNPPVLPGNGGRTGLTGISTKYNDFHCQRIQATHGQRIPPNATIVEVDGETLPIENVARLQDSPSPVLFLSRGVHAVRFRPGERPVEVVITEHLSDTYQDMQQFFDVHGSIRTDELMSRGARAMDVHYAPFLLNFLGASYAARDEWDAAERKFRRALHVNPLFSPAHLNLAHCLMRRERLEDAIREVQLADAFNVGNVFGIAPGISNFRRQINLTHNRPEDIEFNTAVYVSTEPTSVEDERIVALMRGVSKYAVRAEERGKILNNLAVHFADTDRPELALEHFRGALDVLKTAGPDRFALARQVLSHMEATCRDAGFTEAEEYRTMQALVRP